MSQMVSKVVPQRIAGNRCSLILAFAIAVGASVGRSSRNTGAPAALSPSAAGFGLTERCNGISLDTNFGAGSSIRGTRSIPANGISNVKHRMLRQRINRHRG
jgi:hypothetical protein